MQRNLGVKVRINIRYDLSYICPFWNERILMALLVYDKGAEDETFQRRGMINDS